jgi:hypothetical protein
MEAMADKRSRISQGSGLESALCLCQQCRNRHRIYSHRFSVSILESVQSGRHQVLNLLKYAAKPTMLSGRYRQTIIQRQSQDTNFNLPAKPVNKIPVGRQAARR